MFISTALLPINPKLAGNRISDPDPDPNSDPIIESSHKPILLTIKALILAVIVGAYQYKDNLHRNVILGFYCCHVYLGVELVLAISAFFVRLILGSDFEIEPQFNEPYLATSLQDFWGRRWNLMVTRILRPAVYDPIRENSSPVLGKLWSRLPAIFATFVVFGFFCHSFKINRASPNMKLSRRTTMSATPFGKDRLDRHNGYLYGKRFDVRSYEVLTQNIAIQSVFNFLEDTAWDHVRKFWPYDNETGATPGMMKNDLRWVVSRINLQYPCSCADGYFYRGDQLYIETWVGSSGKNGMRRDWEIKWAESGKPVMEDMDMNNRIRNKTLVSWMFEAIPNECLNNYQLSNIIIEYRRECKKADVVQSICEPEDELPNEGSIRYTHLLQVKGESKCEEIVRGETIWKKRHLIPSSD
ncbi:hypothetical protein L1987_16660 [Smallanthus sonchifolius]|uniref:Uncharacterized protein n=1 Tax=Smallanthus sonchifolius TaxID=185202 RepID=A0ACB9IY77_9ASTR|nr:hypothetical protein L1987_16660 [Smallanthus sonchifolius]